MSTPEPAICPAPLANHLKPSFTLPPGATDCHAHVFGAREVYGYADNNSLPPIPIGLAPFYYETGQFDSGLRPSGFHGAAFLVPGAEPQVIIAFEGTDVSGLETRPDNE